MVLAVAALLLQFHAFQPAAPTFSAIPEATTSVSEVSLATSSGIGGVVRRKSTDYVTSAGESSSARMNLTAVHFDSADSKTHMPGTLTTVSLDTTPDTQSFSTVRIPTPSSKEYGVKEAMTMPSRRAWLALSIVQHGAAAFDAYSTRQAVGHGAVEDDPLMRPFASSPAIYVATQVGPVIFDLLARHMQRSEYPMVRRLVVDAAEHERRPLDFLRCAQFGSGSGQALSETLRSQDRIYGLSLAGKTSARAAGLSPAALLFFAKESRRVVRRRVRLFGSRTCPLLSSFS